MSGSQTVEVDSCGSADGLLVGDSYDVVISQAKPLLEIRNAKNELIPNALVKIWGSDEPEGEAEFLKSDKSGIVRVRPKQGETLRVRVLVKGTPYEQPAVPEAARLILRDAKNAPLPNTRVRVWGSDETECQAETLKSDSSGVVRVGAKPGDNLCVRVLTQGTPYSQPTETPHSQPAETPSSGCTSCDALEKLVANNSVASKCKRGSTDKDAVRALQRHLETFGYSLGSWGADGSYGDMTATALSDFIGDIESITLANPDALSAADAQTVIDQCAAGFRRGSPSQPPVSTEPEEPKDPEPEQDPGECVECIALNDAISAASGGVVGKRGDKNATIGALQRHLMKFRISLGMPDSDYGGKTTAAMTTFMRDGLKMSAPTPESFSVDNARGMIRLCSEGYKADAPPQPARRSEGSSAQDKIRSSYITVGNQTFVKWYNDSFVGSFNKKQTDKDYKVGKINESAFRDLFDYIPALVNKNEISLNEFIGHFFIMCREIGWPLAPTSENGTQKRHFEGSGKASYNGYKDRNPHAPSRGSRAFKDQRFAGIQLKDWGFIAHSADVDAWNSRTTYPASPPAATAAHWKPGGSTAVNPKGLTWEQLKEQAKECDYNKFRGRGLNQVTWRENYVAHADDILVECFGKNSDQMSTAELDSAFKDRRVYSAAFQSYCVNRATSAITKLDSTPPQWKPYSLAVLNKDESAKIFDARCSSLRKEMVAAGYEFK